MDFLKGFTLAEIMIALTVIGVITSILLPVAFNNVPNENVMKFKKGNATLAKVINELVTSDKYYKAGDMTKLPDGNYADEIQYFCKAFSDNITTKSVTCGEYKNWIGAAVVDDDKILRPGVMDDLCKNYYKRQSQDKIIASGGIVYYSVCPACEFGAIYENYTNPDDPYHPHLFELNNEDGIKSRMWYKVVCMDIDGIPPNAKKEDCVNECPFGYGVRSDGKILTDARVDEWLEKSIQEKE